MASSCCYLRARREALGLTQAELAEKSGVPQTTISRLERRRVISVRIVTARKLARALRTDLNHLQYGPEPLAARA